MATFDPKTVDVELVRLKYLKKIKIQSTNLNELKFEDIATLKDIKDVFCWHNYIMIHDGERIWQLNKRTFMRCVFTGS